MSGWTYYFLAKIVLHLRGHIPFDVVANGVFAAYLMVPLPARWAGMHAVVWGRRGVNVLVASLLAWHDSWLPPLSSAVQFLRETPLPSSGFLTQLLWRNVVTTEVVLLGAIIAIAALLRRRVRLTPVILVLLAVVAVRAYGRGPDGVDGVLSSFYAREAEQTVRFSSRPNQPFDVVLLHVCSLSWDDLSAVGLDRDRFLNRFDLLFTHFNSVTTHSNPSAIRLLRAGCGQTAHDALYRPAQDGCYLIDALRSSGYQPSAVLNHDGVYGGFAEQVTRLGHVPDSLIPKNAPVRVIDFTGAPVYGDYEVLADWWARRQQSQARSAMLYYNTITLHDGGRRVGEPKKEEDPRDQYRRLVQGLFGDLERFVRRLEADRARVAIVLVAEHGVALRGSPLQPAGLRELPLPSITTVPMGVRLVGPGWFREEHPKQQVVNRPTSYRALATILAQLFARDEPLDAGVLQAIAEQAPSTDFVAENEGATVVKDGERYLAKGRSFGMHWVELPPDAVGGAVAPQAERPEKEDDT